MNREIKFRLWNERDKKMVHQLTEVSISVEGRPRFWTGDDVLIEGKFWDNKLMPLMQYTGEKDATGKEIYEGDVVFIDEGNRAVVFQAGTFGLIEVKDEKPIPLHEYRDGELLIVGNVFENPEFKL